MKKAFFIKLSAIMMVIAILFSTVPLTVWAQVSDLFDNEVQDETILPDDDGNTDEDVTDIYANTVYVSNSEQLAEALEQKLGAICIEADFVVNQTFYVVSNTIIFTTEAHTLTRDPGFGGDMFVVGEYEDGTICEETVTLTLGHTESSDKDLLTIDGNCNNMTTDVVGSVIFVVCGAQADLYDNVTIKNNKKVGNEKTFNEAYGVSYPGYIGGPVAIITANASMNIYGGTYSNNTVNDIVDSSTDEGQVSTQGGAIYSFGLLNVYNGTFDNNYAARGGAFYIYRVANIYQANITNNTASSFGGAIYMPNSTAARLYLGGENPYGDSRVNFTNNTATSYGGAIYARNVLDVQNTYFVENHSTTSGGAIAAFSMVLSISSSHFESNTAKSYGSAIYYSGENSKDAIELTITDTLFKSNSVTASGGAIYMNSNASAYMENVDFTLNTASNHGGAIYLNNAHIDVNGGTFSQNSCSTHGGAIAAFNEASVKLNEVTASGNSSAKGGLIYADTAEVNIYNSKIEENTTTGDGGALYLYTNAHGGVYATTFNNNVAGNNGGAIFAYTDGYNAKTKLVLHSCSYTYNEANCGGAIYASSRSVIDLFNSVAKYNTAAKGGFLYHTTTNTTINLASLILEGNTATTGGPIIWGNSTGAILNLDKSLYIDNNVIGTLDDEYWANAIYNSLKVKNVIIEIPNYIDYNGAEVVPELPVNPTNISSSEELENALTEGKTLLRIIEDFEIDRTFYIYRKTTIYSVNAHTLTRAPGFGGDIFVVGEHSDGTLCESPATLILGDPESKQKNMLTIDGNRDNMTTDVVGSVIFVVCGSQADIYENITIKNNKKVGNEKTLTEAYGVSYVGRVGGSVAIVTASAIMNIYGGTFENNAVNDITDSSTDEGQVSTHGGVIYDFGRLNIYGGTFENNHAGRGGVLYCYRTINLYNADFKNNTASDLGGVVYMPNSTSAVLNIGAHNEIVDSKVTFTGNSASNHGGVIYGNNKINIQNATFTQNSAKSGAAIISYNAILNISDSYFIENNASNHGGALYVSGHNTREVETDLTITGCTFTSNTSTNNGGAIYLHNGAVALIQVVTFNKNSGSNGGAVYSTGSQLTMSSCIIEENSADSNGGGVALYSSSTATLNKITAADNTAKIGGFLYSTASSLNLYRSDIENNTSSSNGGGMALYGDATANIYATNFKNNSSGSGNGGGLFLYTNLGEVLVHSCTFTENSGNSGGAVYASNKAIATLYNTIATNNSATKGGFLYETTTGTIITLIGVTLSGNTATDGGPIIWGNSTGAKLYIDKGKYTDSDYTGTLDSTYWGKAIVNSLKVYECTQEIPKWLDYQEESYDHMADAVDVSTATQLENAIKSGARYIRIIVDIEVDRTFYITGNTTIFSTLPRKLTRAPEFSGDMFVVGQDEDGKSALLLGGNAQLVLGNPLSTKENLLIIDGNKDNMTVPVNGSVLFVCYSSKVTLHTNVTAINSYKTDNERTYNEAYKLSRPNRIGGAFAIVASGSLNIYGGIYKDNRINDEDTSSEETRNCTIGGLIYNYSNVYIYGGTFENNQAARGSIIYNYNVLRIYGGEFINNVATVNGGVIYAPNTAPSHTYIGSESKDASTVLFQNNTSSSHGGVIYSSALCALVIYGNTTFNNNTSSEGNGGAICSYGQLTARNTVFSNNSAKSKGGAVYTANSSDTYVTRYNDFESCTFKNNRSTLGGAIAVYSSNSEFENGGIVTVTDSTFTSNIAASQTSSSAASYGGAIYVERRSSLTVNNSKFTQNTARTEGGAIYAGGLSNVKISDSNFNKNAIEDKGKHGGAISIHSVTLFVTSTKFTNNVAQAQAGALYISYSSSYDKNSEVTLKDNTFTNNSTKGLGGAIYVTKQSVTEEKRILTTSNTEFSTNSASQGGAMFFTSGTTAYMTDMTFKKNSATEDNGGAIQISGGKVEIDNATFTSNTSVGSGAGIYLASNAELTLNDITATSNKTEASGGFIYGENCTLNVYNSKINTNTANVNAGGVALYGGAGANIYNTSFDGNKADANGGGIFLYTDLTPSVIHSCTFTNNEGVYGGAIYASGKAIADIYNVTARNNASNRGGFLYHTTTDTEITLVGATVANNTATKGGPIIWGNSTGATLHIDKSKFTDENHTGTMDSTYWSATIYNKLTVDNITATIPACEEYESKRSIDSSTPTTKKPVSVNDVFNLAKKSSDGSINIYYDKLPKLNNSSNFMSKKVTTFPNINGQNVTVDTFVYPTNGTADNCNVGAGLLIYQAMCYKQAYPDEEVYIDLSYYRFSIEAAVNINRNSRYFGYMRQLGGNANYDAFGFVRISYLLISAAKMGIHVTAIGHIDAYPLTPNTMGLYEYFTSQLNDPCDPDYVSDRVIGDYLNFCMVDWTLQNKGGTDMMHTKMVAVSHYLDKDGNVHRNAIWTGSTNLDGINGKGVNANWKQQTATIVSGHEEIYKTAVNYLRLITKYKNQEGIYEFQNLVNRLSTEQAQLILSGNGDLIAEEEQIIYLGTENDTVFEMYFTPLGGDILAWDEVQNPYCKYLRKLYNSEDYIIFTWNAAEYNGNFAFGQQIESMIIAAFHDNRNVNNKIYGRMENFDATTFDDLVVGVDIGYKSFNEMLFGEVHNKDLQFSYVENGQRYYVTLLNSMNFHSGSMYYQSNFALVIKETNCNENSVFFTLADETTTGIVEHAYDYSGEKEYIPEEMEDGYKYYPCLKCDKILITETIHRESNWIVDKKATTSENGVRHRNCLACGVLLESQEYTVSQDESSLYLADATGRTFSATIEKEQRLQLNKTPHTFEAVLNVPKDYNERAGVIVGNYDETKRNKLNFEIHEMGKVRLFIVNNGETYDCLFDTDIRSNNPVHIALTVNDTIATLYVNGKKVETKELPFGLPTLTNNYIIGGDERIGNRMYFKETLYSVNLFSDARTSYEIERDKIAVHTNEDALLLSKYFINNSSKPDSYVVSAKTFSQTSQINLGKLSQTPLTIEAVIQLPTDFADRGGVILGNYSETGTNRLNLEVHSSGKLRLYFTTYGETNDCMFNVDVRSNGPVHIAIVVDGLVATAYLNGIAKDSVTLTCTLPSVLENLKIGSDNRLQNAQYFKGSIYSVNLFSSVRTTEQIKNDVILVTGNESDLICSRNFAYDGAEWHSTGFNAAKFSNKKTHIVGTLPSTPKTFEATVIVPESFNERVGVILGNYDENELTLNKLNFEIYTLGRVRLFIMNNGLKYDCLFDTDIRSSEPVHIALTVDGTIATLYVNGKLTETKELPFGLPILTNEYRIGGDKRGGNVEYFKCGIYSVNLFSDVRTAAEISADTVYVSNDSEDLLYSAYFTSDDVQNKMKNTVITGRTFTAKTPVKISNRLKAAPQTFEATIHVPKDFDDRVGVILARYDDYCFDKITFEIYTLGRVRLFIMNNGVKYDCLFNTDIRSDNPVHIALSVDGTIATLYVNGEKSETRELPFCLPKLTENYRVGGDGRDFNYAYFQGTIYSVNMFSTPRTAEMIKNDFILVDSSDPSLVYSATFAEDICEFFGHDESDVIADFNTSTESCGLNHTECLICEKIVYCYKSPAISEIVESVKYDTSKGLVTDATSGGYAIDSALASTPHTFEALIHLGKDYTARAGVIIGNYDGSDKDQINFEVYTNGTPRLYYKVNGVAYTYNFKTDIRSDSLTHIALTIDGLTARLYVNGQLRETIALKAEMPENLFDGFVVGSDNRAGNAQHFKGTIYYASIFSDVRTAEEITVDRYIATSDSDGLLFTKNFMTSDEN